MPYEREFLYRRAILHLTARFSDYIVTLTRQDKENYEKLLHRKGRITFIYNPIEPKKFSKNQERESLPGKRKTKNRSSRADKDRAEREKAESSRPQMGRKGAERSRTERESPDHGRQIN